jgi:hypothetical protein
MALTWVDRDRRYFASTCSSLAPGTSYMLKRLRHVSMESNASPEVVGLTVPQPQPAEIYHSACAMIDRYNRCRQDDLRMEHKVKSLTWWKRVNLSVVGMCAVDAYLVFKSVARSESITQRDFYIEPAHHLIDNVFDSVGLRGRQSQPRALCTMKARRPAACIFT